MRAKTRWVGSGPIQCTSDEPLSEVSREHDREDDGRNDCDNRCRVHHAVLDHDVRGENAATTGTVLILVAAVSTSEKKNSFQENMNAYTAADTSPGVTRGRMTRRRAPRRVHPSMRAASSRSGGSSRRSRGGSRPRAGE